MANEDPVLFFRRYKAPVLIAAIQYAPGCCPNQMEATAWDTGAVLADRLAAVPDDAVDLGDAGRACGDTELLGFRPGAHAGRANPASLLPLPDLLEQRRATAAPDAAYDL